MHVITQVDVCWRRIDAREKALRSDLPIFISLHCGVLD